MLQYFNQKRGQSTLEYAVLIIIIVGALLSIQFYIKRSIQGRWKQAADDIGDQYSDGNTNVIKTTIKNSNTNETFNQGITESSLNAPEVTNTTENSVIVNTDYEYWGTQATTT
jgi:uncharacterized protein (UPF0333 family)